CVLLDSLDGERRVRDRRRALDQAADDLTRHWTRSAPVAARPADRELKPELAVSVCSEPSGNHHFLVRVELVRVPPVYLQVAEEAVLRAAEREVRHGRG